MDDGVSMYYLCNQWWFGVVCTHISLVETAMASTTLTLDLEKVLQMPNVVEAGNFDIPQKM